MRNATIRNLLLGAATVQLLASMAPGQQPATRPEVNLAVTYQAERNNISEGESFWRQGGAFELSANVWHGIGMAMNIDGASGKNLLGTGVDLNTLTTTFGPRYSLSTRRGRLAFFGEGLLGEAHGWQSVFPQTGGAVADYDTFALQVGGGVDYRIGRHLAIRPIQADWLRTEFPNATTNVQNNTKLGAGVVLRLPQ